MPAGGESLKRSGKMEKKAGKGKKTRNKSISLSLLMTGLVVGLVTVACISGVSIFAYFYVNSVEENAITNSDQAVSQTENMVADYITDMSGIMEMVRVNMNEPEEERNDFFQNLIYIRKDVEAITVHSSEGELIAYWSNGNELKDEVDRNLSYILPEGNGLLISAPHVENLFQDHYPWVVTFSEKMQTEGSRDILVSVDIRFSKIAGYVDAVGIGKHGYCFIADKEGNIVYHPQQQLIYAGLKDELIENIRDYRDGTHTVDGVIYTIHSMPDCDWRIIGISYVDELIEAKVTGMIRAVLFVAGMVILATILAGAFFAYQFSKPAKDLTSAMRRFVREADRFEFYPVRGTEEIETLSDSFGHMVLQIQELMDKVRNDEITLRKTELNALQAQINPHFLYNTLDSIAWMCEMGRTDEAIEMVNALARLFRISISKGHELITVEQELKHAESYLIIQKFRYKNQFTYQFRVEESCLEYFCNKITLQPLIENAIVHGLDMSEEGEIIIEVFEKDRDIIMSVSDNGIGMTEEQCREILQKDTHSKSGIGIKNVNDRVRIYFGEEYGVTISSEPDVGTKVEIRIPKVLEEDHEK